MTRRAPITKAQQRQVIEAARETGLAGVWLKMPGGAWVFFPVDPNATPAPDTDGGKNPCDAAFGVAP